MLTDKQIDNLIFFLKENRKKYRSGDFNDYGKMNIVGVIGEMFVYMSDTGFNDLIETLESAKERSANE